MFVTILVITVIAAGIMILVMSLSGKERHGWLEFFRKGKESGFSLKEIELLRKLAVKSKLEDPLLLFTSQNQLDLCIRALVRTMQMSQGGPDDQLNHDFLSKLYDFRTKVEMEKPKIKHGIRSSKHLKDGQNLRILVEGTGVFKSQIVKNTANYLAISRPVSNKIPGSFSWQSQPISVYFWREDDAGYVFDSRVLDEVFSKGISSLKISHSETMFRTQKRKSIRVKLHKAAYLYVLENEEEMNKIEVHPGQKCFLVDLSDTGCAATIGGRANPGLRIKVQFALNNLPVVMSGTVRSVEYKEELNRSILHVEADPLPIEIRNRILGEVFGTLPEEEDDLPFRMLEKEADEISAEPLTEEENFDLPDEDAENREITL